MPQRKRNPDYNLQRRSPVRPSRLPKYLSRRLRALQRKQRVDAKHSGSK